MVFFMFSSNSTEDYRQSNPQIPSVTTQPLSINSQLPVENIRDQPQPTTQTAQVYASAPQKKRTSVDTSRKSRESMTYSTSQVEDIVKALAIEHKLPEKAISQLIGSPNTYLTRDLLEILKRGLTKLTRIEPGKPSIVQKAAKAGITLGQLSQVLCKPLIFLEQNISAIERFISQPIGSSSFHKMRELGFSVDHIAKILNCSEHNLERTVDSIQSSLHEPSGSPALIKLLQSDLLPEQIAGVLANSQGKFLERVKSLSRLCVSARGTSCLGHARKKGIPLQEFLVLLKQQHSPFENVEKGIRQLFTPSKQESLYTRANNVGIEKATIVQILTRNPRNFSNTVRVIGQAADYAQKLGLQERKEFIAYIAIRNESVENWVMRVEQSMYIETSSMQTLYPNASSLSNDLSQDELLDSEMQSDASHIHRAQDTEGMLPNWYIMHKWEIDEREKLLQSGDLKAVTIDPPQKVRKKHA